MKTKFSLFLFGSFYSGLALFSYAADPLEDKIIQDSNYTLDNQSAQYNHVSIISKTNDAYVSVKNNSILAANSINISGENQTTLNVRGSTLKVANNMIMNNNSTNPDDEVRLDVGRQSIIEIGSIDMMSNKTFLLIRQATCTIGTIRGNSNSIVSLGDPEVGGSLTMNGTITCGKLDVFGSFQSIHFGNELFNSIDSAGNLLLFDYQILGSQVDNTSTFEHLDKLLQKALTEAKDHNTQYDLSNAAFVYTGSQKNNEGPGTISLTGLKPIPEPSSAMLSLLGLSALLLKRRRK